MTRLSAKQIKFLTIVEVQNRPVLLEVREGPTSLPHFVGCDFAWNWGFMSEGEARRWLQNLQSRGLLVIEKECFVRITDAGKEALVAAKAKQEGAAP